MSKHIETKIFKCISCGEEYTRKEVKRKYGDQFPYGYCKPQCYTFAILVV